VGKERLAKGGEKKGLQLAESKKACLPANPKKGKVKDPNLNLLQMKENERRGKGR